VSRIGKKPVPLAGATLSLEGRIVRAKGPKGELSFALHDLMNIEVGAAEATMVPANDSKQAKALWGMSRTMVANMVTGVTTGYTRTLELVGVGYRAAMDGSDLSLSLGYSHPVIYKAPEGVTFAVPKPTEITITGNDKQQLGQVAAEIRAWRPPEPYKGKGVRYQGERVRRKEGKKK
jgi:large subunit ribosomal protein L6